jgi:hypothetical protein
VTLTGWIFMVGLRVFDIGALVVWVVWFFRQRDDDDEGGGGPGGKGGPDRGDPGGPPLPDADPWPERRRDHLGDRPSSTKPARPHVAPRPAPDRVRISRVD